jgi:methionine-rich copper-binding protein CopC
MMRLILRNPRVVFFQLLLFVGCFALPHNALAHAVLEKSVPAANTTVEIAKFKAGSLPIVLVFNSRVDAAHSSLSLLAPGGKAIPLTIEPATDPNVLKSTASAIKPGRYSLHWQAVANDGHITRGAILFVAQ